MPDSSVQSLTKILVVDDDVFNREGIRLYLQQQGFAIVEAGDEATAYQAAIEHQLEAAVIDIVIPPTPESKLIISHSVGIRLAKRLKHLYPSLAIVIFSAHEDRGSEVWDMVREGMRGIAYKLKGCSPRALLNAIRDARAGRVLIDSEVLTNSRSLANEIMERMMAIERPWVETAMANLDQLTPRERDITQRLAASHTIQGIAGALGISKKTVESHINHIYNKLGLNELTDEGTDLRKIVILAKACMIKDLQAGGPP